MACEITSTASFVAMVHGYLGRLRHGEDTMPQLCCTLAQLLTVMSCAR